jgi:cell division protein FtsZ
VAEAAHPDANIIFGAMVDEKIQNEVWVTVVATGYGERPSRRSTPRADRERVPADREPTVRRTGSTPRPGALDDLVVPEFLPRR